MATQLDLEEVLRNIYERTNRKRKNPARHPATSQGTYEEIPIEIRAVVPVSKIADPRWAIWILSGEVEDHFNNTGDADSNLESHTTDSGHTWTAEQGNLQISTGDWVVRP
jgi:hypothetical protein